MSRYARRLQARATGAPLQALRHPSVRASPTPVADPFADATLESDAPSTAAPEGGARETPIVASPETQKNAPTATLSMAVPLPAKIEMAASVANEPARTMSVPVTAPQPSARGDALAPSMQVDRPPAPRAAAADDARAPPIVVADAPRVGGEARGERVATQMPPAVAIMRPLARTMPAAQTTARRDDDVPRPGNEPMSRVRATVQQPVAVTFPARLDPPPPPHAPPPSPPQITIGRISVVVDAPRPQPPVTRILRAVAAPIGDGPALPRDFGLGQL